MAVVTGQPQQGQQQAPRIPVAPGPAQPMVGGSAVIPNPQVPQPQSPPMMRPGPSGAEEIGMGLAGLGQGLQAMTAPAIEKKRRDEAMQHDKDMAELEKNNRKELQEFATSQNVYGATLNAWDSQYESNYNQLLTVYTDNVLNNRMTPDEAMTGLHTELVSNPNLREKATDYFNARLNLGLEAGPTDPNTAADAHLAQRLDMVTSHMAAQLANSKTEGQKRAVLEAANRGVLNLTAMEDSRQQMLGVVQSLVSPKVDSAVASVQQKLASGEIKDRPALMQALTGELFSMMQADLGGTTGADFGYQSAVVAEYGARGVEGLQLDPITEDAIREGLSMAVDRLEGLDTKSLGAEQKAIVVSAVGQLRSLVGDPEAGVPGRIGQRANMNAMLKDSMLAVVNSGGAGMSKEELVDNFRVAFEQEVPSWYLDVRGNKGTQLFKQGQAYLTKLKSDPNFRDADRIQPNEDGFLTWVPRTSKDSTYFQPPSPLQPEIPQETQAPTQTAMGPQQAPPGYGKPQREPGKTPEGQPMREEDPLMRRMLSGNPVKEVAGMLPGNPVPDSMRAGGSGEEAVTEWLAQILSGTPSDRDNDIRKRLQDKNQEVESREKNQELVARMLGYPNSGR